MAGGAEQQAGALTAKRHNAGERKVRHQALELFADRQRVQLGQPGHAQQRPRQFSLQNLDGGVLEFRLLGGGAKHRVSQRIHTHQTCATGTYSAQKLFTPVHGDEGVAHAHFVAGGQRHHDGAVPAAHGDQVAVGELAARHVVGVHLDAGFGYVAKQSAQRADTAHAVPLVAQATGGQRERVAGFAWLGHRLVSGVGEPGLAVRSGENAVFVQACLAGGFARAQRPLPGAGVQHGVVHAGNVEVAAPRGFAVLVPDGFGRGVVEQCGGAGPARFPATGQIPRQSTSRAGPHRARPRQGARG